MPTNMSSTVVDRMNMAAQPNDYGDKIQKITDATGKPLQYTVNKTMMRVELPGFGEAMRSESMKITPNAILSRSLAAVVERSLVIALPGKPSGAVECLGFVVGAIPHAVALAQRVPTSC